MIDELIGLVPPPHQPVNTGDDAEWAAVLTEIGMPLPLELFEISSRYGSGHFICGDFWIEIHSVFRPAYSALVEFNRRVFAQEAVRMPDPYEALFELGAYGWDDDVGTMGRVFWNTMGPSDLWQVGLSRPLQRYPFRLTEFLFRCFSGEIQPQGFPESFSGLTFVPADPAG